MSAHSERRRQDLVVAGLDGSDTSVSAAQWAASLADAWDATLLLTYALPRDIPLYTPAAILAEADFLAELTEDANEILRAAGEAVAARHPDLRIETSHGPGPAALHLVESAANARMIVLGRTGVGAVQSRLVGTTALHVVGRATCPVTVWAGEDTTGPSTKPVVVGVDGSETSDRAVRYAFDYADRFGAPLTAVHAWTGAGSVGAWGTGMFVDWDEVRDEEAALLSQSLSGLSADHPDVRVTEVSTEGNPARTLLDHADGAGLVVVGSHGRGTLLSAVLGSTSQNVLHHAQCPVTVVRRA
ncbi:universal stress protein [Rhodococcus rhodnii]|uniref:Universal stress protein n=2 Tax=Rhodococcus rhodnii TaxID=38312 RepID=R7WHT9_9NOCA|nr:universal stress protein [Rhodococcus rhodnii]EOM74703.1 universal stress protein [Rhodococcus rhodnii LMG 5362]TXG88933.1 universal stress protein [Rhodococcus rhodnii]